MNAYSLLNITVYPIKGLSGIEMSEAITTARGLKDDRRFMLVDDQGVMLSQRQVLAFAEAIVIDAGDAWLVRREGFDVTVPKNNHSNQIVRTQIWSHTVDAYEVSVDISKALSKMFDLSCRLVFMSDVVIRNKSLIKSPSTTLLSFADGYPYLILGNKSMDLLNEKCSLPMVHQRFRANVIIDTKEAHEEDKWDKFKIGDVRFRVIKPCVRCQVVNIDPHTAMQSKEPLQTLAGYRKFGNGICFGANTVCLEPEKTIKIGDLITIQ